MTRAPAKGTEGLQGAVKAIAGMSEAKLEKKIIGMYREGAFEGTNHGPIVVYVPGKYGSNNPCHIVSVQRTVGEPYNVRWSERTLYQHMKRRPQAIISPRFDYKAYLQLQ